MDHIYIVHGTYEIPSKCWIEYKNQRRFPCSFCGIKCNDDKVFMVLVDANSLWKHACKCCYDKLNNKISISTNECNCIVHKNAHLDNLTE